jgi:alpha-N-arabinofuranosidase
MPTYPEWDRTVLEYCWDTVDYLSLHYYAGNRTDDTPSYLALARQFEDHLDSLAGTIRYVKALKRSKHDVKLSWDEWNIWYKNHVVDGSWAEAPHLIEEVYNLEDALVAAQWMNVFLRRCDVLEIACLAQIVNVIAPILTNATGMVKQTIYYPFMLYSRYASGLALEPLVHAPMYATSAYGEQPLLDVSASHDPASSESAVFLVNRSLSETITTDVIWRTGAPQRVTAQYVLAGTDPKAANTFDAPNAIVPQTLAGQPINNGSVTVQLPPLSLSVLTCR